MPCCVVLRRVPCYGCALCVLLRDTRNETQNRNLYSKLIGWVIEGRKYVAAGGDLTFLVVVFLIEINGWHTIFFSYCTSVWVFLPCCSVVEYILFTAWFYPER